MTSRRTGVFRLASALAAALPAWLPAQELAMHEERASLTVGAFVTQPDTSARLDSVRGFGTEIELENDLGLQTSRTVARLAGYFLVGERHRVDLSFFEFARDATKRLEKVIEFGDRTFTIGRDIDASSDVSVFKASYTFMPVVRERGDFGITAGIYTAKVDLALTDRTAGIEESEDFTAPLPVLGVRGQYALTPRFALRGSLELFGLDAGDASGRLRDFYVGADYSFNSRVALGLAYNYVSMAIDAEDTDGFQGTLDWGYDGWLLYLKSNFGG